MNAKKYCWLVVCSPSVFEKKIWEWRGRAKLFEQGKEVVGDETDFFSTPPFYCSQTCEVMVLTTKGVVDDAAMIRRLRRQAKKYNISLRVVDPQEWFDEGLQASPSLFSNLSQK